MVFQCAICSAWASSDAFLEQHMRDKHPEALLQGEEGDESRAQTAAAAANAETLCGDERNDSGDTPSILIQMSSGMWDEVNAHLEAFLSTAATLDVDLEEQEVSTLRRPLHVAAGAGKVRTVGLLLECGADPGSHDWRASTPLHYAAEGFPDCVANLVEHAMETVDAQNADGDTPLHLACISRCERCVLHLLQTAANPNIQNAEGATPLSAVLGDERLEPMLRSYGATCNKVTSQLKISALKIPEYVSPIHFAASPPSSPGSCHPLSPQARNSPHRKIRKQRPSDHGYSNRTPPARASGSRRYNTPYDESSIGRYQIERMRKFRERRQRRSRSKVR